MKERLKSDTSRVKRYEQIVPPKHDTGRNAWNKKETQRKLQLEILTLLQKDKEKHEMANLGSNKSCKNTKTYL